MFGGAVGEKVLVAFFVKGDPAAVWTSHIEPMAATVAAGGHATIGLAAGFVGVIPGLESYADQLW